MRIDLLLKLAATYEELVGKPAGWAYYQSAREPEAYPFPELIEEPWTGELPLSFDMRTFMQLPDLETIHLYLQGITGRDIQELGEGKGSSRQVFELPGGKLVLKVAKNPIGMEQNQIEWQVSHDKRIWNYVAKTYEKHPKFYWLISERVDPSDVQGLEILGALEKDPAFADAVREFRIENRDFLDPNHWGRTSDGRIVLFDYGLSAPLHQRYYSAR